MVIFIPSQCNFGDHWTGGWSAAHTDLLSCLWADPPAGSSPPSGFSLLGLVLASQPPPLTRGHSSAGWPCITIVETPWVARTLRISQTSPHFQILARFTPYMHHRDFTGRGQSTLMYSAKIFLSITCVTLSTLITEIWKRANTNVSSQHTRVWKWHIQCPHLNTISYSSERHLKSLYMYSKCIRHIKYEFHWRRINLEFLPLNEKCLVYHICQLYFVKLIVTAHFDGYLHLSLAIRKVWRPDANLDITLFNVTWGFS